jgi:cytochrome d ubiquinol oxidase subunit II
VSSFGAPLFFGFVLSGLLATHPGTPSELPSDVGFAAVYVTPWLDAFGLVSGLFIASLFAYAAAVFFYGELRDVSEKRLVKRRIHQLFASTFILGGGVLALGAFTGRVEPAQALHPLQLLSQAVAASGVALLYFRMKKDDIWGMRLSVGAQILAILLGWWSAHHPQILRTEGGSLTIDDVAAPYITQLWLVIGLVVVLGLVIPLLVVLYRVFGRAD